MSAQHRNARRNETQFGNLIYMNAANPNGMANGLRLKPWENREPGADGKMHVASRDVVTVLGSLDREGNISKKTPFKVIPISKTDRPIFIAGGSRASVGSFQWIAEGNSKKLMLTRMTEGDDAFYMHVQAGFQLSHHGAIDGHLNRLILDSIEPTVPGSFSLDGASIQMEEAAGLEFTEAAATRLRWAVAREHPLIGAPTVRHDLWRIPPGAGILVQNVDGMLFRAIHEKDWIRIVDAEGYRQVFMDLEMRRRAQRAEERARKAAKVASSSDTDVVDPTTTP